MTIWCCCSQIRKKEQRGKGSIDQDDIRGRVQGSSTNQHQNQYQCQELPCRPPPARLSQPDSSALGLSPHATTARSSLTNPLPCTADEALIQPAELVMEDSEDDNHGEVQVHNSRNRSTSTLEAVKARIRRHLSQDSISRQSETEEQIARRAEVKRLMRRRIQEELQSETDEAISLSSTLRPLAAASVTLAGNGPRDTIEFVVEEANRENELQHPDALKTAKLTDGRTDGKNDQRLSKTMSRRSSTMSCGQENHPHGSRPVSLCDWVLEAAAAANASRPDAFKHARRRSSLPDIPHSPTLRPISSTSFHNASSIASWRLPLSDAQLADLLALEQDSSPYRPVVGPVVSPAASVFTTDAIQQQPVRQKRSNSSSLAAHGSDALNRLGSSQASLYSHSRRRLPTSNSAVWEESVGLWLRAQSQQFRLSITSRPQSYREHGAEPFADAPSETVGQPHRNHAASPSAAGSLVGHSHPHSSSPKSARPPCILTASPLRVQAEASQLIPMGGSEGMQRSQRNRFTQQEPSQSQSPPPSRTPKPAKKPTVSYHSLNMPSLVRKGLASLGMAPFKCK